ncbi:hypothetical protein PM082_012987 [Marasmius tenuissimus]|nr:hypothetical protein PM082_012987 [Marasmius tenuissimus]
MEPPPTLPERREYTQYWCEENIYLLAKAFTQDHGVDSSWDTFVTFISNENKTVALWSQKLSKEAGLPVVWDYHVILVLRSQRDATSWVYDFDTRLGVPVSWRGKKLVPHNEGGDELKYIFPPPSYPCICGPESVSRGVVHNLMEFIAMLPSTNGIGEIHSLQSIDAFFDGSTHMQEDGNREDECVEEGL